MRVLALHSKYAQDRATSRHLQSPWAGLPAPTFVPVFSFAHAAWTILWKRHMMSRTLRWFSISPDAKYLSVVCNLLLIRTASLLYSTHLSLFLSISLTFTPLSPHWCPCWSTDMPGKFPPTSLSLQPLPLPGPLSQGLLHEKLFKSFRSLLTCHHVSEASLWTTWFKMKAHFLTHYPQFCLSCSGSFSVTLITLWLTRWFTILFILFNVCLPPLERKL